MNLSENLGNSFEYAKKMFSDLGRLVILIVLDIIPIVNWIVIGYAARVLRESPSSNVPPKLEKYGEMFVDGAKVFFVSLIYMIIPVILFVAGIGSFVSMAGLGGAGLLASNPGVPMLGGAGIALVLIGIVLAFILLLILSIGTAHMIKTGKLGKAFAFGEIFSIIGSIGWLRYVGWAILIFVIAAIVGGVAGAIPIVGWVISLVISPVLTIFIFRSLGLLYNEGAPPELRSEAMPSSTGGGMTCASCGTTLQPNQKFCPSCGAPAPAPPQSSMADSKFCTSCGAKLPAGATFCGKCGAKQS